MIKMPTYLDTASASRSVIRNYVKEVLTARQDKNSIKEGNTEKTIDTLTDSIIQARMLLSTNKHLLKEADLAKLDKILHTLETDIFIQQENLTQQKNYIALLFKTLQSIKQEVRQTNSNALLDFGFADEFDNLDMENVELFDNSLRVKPIAKGKPLYNITSAACECIEHPGGKTYGNLKESLTNPKDTFIYEVTADELLHSSVSGYNEEGLVITVTLNLATPSFIRNMSLITGNYTRLIALKYKSTTTDDFTAYNNFNPKAAWETRIRNTQDIIDLDDKKVTGLQLIFNVNRPYVKYKENDLYTYRFILHNILFNTSFNPEGVIKGINAPIKTPLSTDIIWAGTLLNNTIGYWHGDDIQVPVLSKYCDYRNNPIKEICTVMRESDSAAYVKPSFPVNSNMSIYVNRSQVTGYINNNCQLTLDYGMSGTKVLVTYYVNRYHTFLYKDKDGTYYSKPIENPVAIERIPVSSVPNDLKFTDMPVIAAHEIPPLYKIKVIEVSIDKIDFVTNTLFLEDFPVLPPGVDKAVTIRSTNFEDKTLYDLNQVPILPVFTNQDGEKKQYCVNRNIIQFQDGISKDNITDNLLIIEYYTSIKSGLLDIHLLANDTTPTIKRIHCDD